MHRFIRKKELLNLPTDKVASENDEGYTKCYEDHCLFAFEQLGYLTDFALVFGFIWLYDGKSVSQNDE